VTKAIVFSMLVLAVSARATAQPQDGSELRAGAWDHSLVLENQGQLYAARALLERAWGQENQSYEVTVRLAWLSLRVGDSDQAIRYYERARTLEGAGPEATQGLVSALLLAGEQRRENQDLPGARAAWQKALTLDPDSESARRALQARPSRRIDPEVWGAYLSESIGAFQASGWAVFGHVPLVLGDRWRLRAAYRHAELRTPNRSQLGFAAGQSRYSQDDAYLGGGFDARYWGLNLLGFMLFPSTESTVPAEAISLRLGQRYGIVLEQMALGRSRGVNTQLLPYLFFWPSPQVGLGAGARLTFDDVGEEVSGQAGVTLVTSSIRLELGGQVGVERWPVVPSVPLVLTLGQDVTLGGTLTAVVPLSNTWALGAQGQAEQLEAQGYRGWYFSAAAGLVWSPRMDP
jgi:tetratricopeptide (TPR) repeat protein